MLLLVVVCEVRLDADGEVAGGLVRALFVGVARVYFVWGAPGEGAGDAGAAAGASERRYFRAVCSRVVEADERPGMWGLAGPS